ncbi:MAG: hypothetical protein QOH71_315 [Blastocatellia bacterium]|nr:hypothetical protein [Blastocatellia bacterium]
MSSQWVVGVEPCGPVKLGKLEEDFFSFLSAEPGEFVKYFNFAHGRIILSNETSINVMNLASTIAGVTVRLVHLLRPQKLRQHLLVTSLAHRQR